MRAFHLNAELGLTRKGDNPAHEWTGSLRPDLGDLPLPWLAALDDAGRANMEFSAGWLQNLAENALAEEELPGLYDVRRADTARPAALLPVLHTLGSRRLQGLSTFYTSLFTPVVTEEAPEAALAALFSTVRHDGWHSLRLSPLAQDAPIFGQTLAALGQAGWLAYPFYCFGNWYMPVAGRTFAEYFQGLASQVRNTVKRREKKFLAEGRGQLELVESGPRLEAAIESWDRIYRSSWKKPEPFPRFMPGLIRLCAERGWLRLGLAHYDGEAVAAQIWIVSHGRAAIYKLAYDERFAPLSAGTVLTAFLMRQVIDVDHVEEIDYLIGDDAYKKDWLSHRRERWGIMAYNPATAAGLLGAARESAGRALKPLLARWRARSGKA